MSKTAILESVKALDLARVKAILAAKPALRDVIDRQGRNLLQLACGVPTWRTKVPRERAVRMAAFLIDAGLPIDAPYGRDKCTPLFEAVARGRNPALIKLLLARGAQVAHAPGGGLFAAGWWDDTEDLDLLLDAGAEIDVVVGITPFLASWSWQRFSAAKRLALRGANVNFQDRKGRTALHIGIDKEFDSALLTWLVTRGASIDLEDREGVSPRVKAGRKRDKRFLAALIKRESTK